MKRLFFPALALALMVSLQPQPAHAQDNSWNTFWTWINHGEAYIGMAECAVPIIGGWIVDSILPHDAWTDGVAALIAYRGLQVSESKEPARAAGISFARG
jgi:hypothetical protein